MPIKITFDLWAGLQTGRVAYIGEVGGVYLTYMKGVDEFVLEKPNAVPHRLLGAVTDAARLDAHWQGFAKQ